MPDKISDKQFAELIALRLQGVLSQGFFEYLAYGKTEGFYDTDIDEDLDEAVRYKIIQNLKKNFNV